MKKTSFLFFFCCTFLFASAQVRVGVKIGLSSTNLDTEGLRLLDQGAAERFELALDNSDLGIYGGFFYQCANWILYHPTRIQLQF